MPTNRLSESATIVASALIVIEPEPATAPLSLARTAPLTVAFAVTRPALIPPSDPPRTHVRA